MIHVTVHRKSDKAGVILCMPYEKGIKKSHNTNFLLANMSFQVAKIVKFLFNA